jgi:hypothetical protein
MWRGLSGLTDFEAGTMIGAKLSALESRWNHHEECLMRFGGNYEG